MDAHCVFKNIINRKIQFRIDPIFVAWKNWDQIGLKYVNVKETFVQDPFT